MGTLISPSWHNRFDTLLYCAIFSFSVFCQCMVFHYQAFHNVLVSSFIYSLRGFWMFYLPKISVSVFLASLVPLFKNRTWTLIVSGVIDVWIIAELVYYRVNGFFLEAFSFTMVDNMNGFWSGVFPFIYFGDLLVLVPTFILFAAFICFGRDGNRYPRLMVCVFFVSIIFHATSFFIRSEWMKMLFNNKEMKMDVSFVNPFSRNSVENFWGGEWVNTSYISNTSVLHGFIFDVVGLMRLPFEQKVYEITEEDVYKLTKSLTAPIPTPPPSKIVPTTNLYIILFESLESWSITPYTTPSICQFVEGNDNILLCRRVIKQARVGTSADGQMIINTGMLPVSEGTVCYRYPSNIFPSLSELYCGTALIMPAPIDVWNQWKMNDAYQIDSCICISSRKDEDAFVELSNICKDYPYIMTLTIASHTPFNAYPDDSEISFCSEMPELMSNYLNCVHYTDYCLSDFLDKVDDDETLRNSTIVITGDHTIFDHDRLKQFDEYRSLHDTIFPVIESYCPLIIYSPNIKEKTVIDEEVYQMDIYPTILNLIGCGDSYYWKGFGKNLLDSISVRPFSEEEAFVLSDKIIRSNYFKNVVGR